MDNNQNSFIPSSTNGVQTHPNEEQQVNDMHTHDNDFLNHVPNNTEIPNIQNQNYLNREESELNSIIKPNKNKFINNDIGSSDAALTSLNVENVGKVDYSKDPRVQANLNQLENNGQQKNTITIGSEGKIFLIIIALLLVFIFVLPTIFDYIREIQYK